MGSGILEEGDDEDPVEEVEEDASDAAAAADDDGDDDDASDSVAKAVAMRNAGVIKVVSFMAIGYQIPKSVDKCMRTRIIKERRGKSGNKQIGWNHRHSLDSFPNTQKNNNNNAQFQYSLASIYPIPISTHKQSNLSSSQGGAFLRNNFPHPILKAGVLSA